MIGTNIRRSKCESIRTKKIHESLNGDQSSLKKSHKRGTAKKYYAVTGETISGLSRATVHY